jgi:hypothetical protein
MSGLLPIPSIPTPGPGLTGPDFDFSDQIKLPAEIGVKDGDSMESVVNAVKGVSFYIDTIGFGAPTLPLSSGMDIRPIGVNFWSKTGLKCSNGADMWSYTETIPKGDALGKRVQAALGGTQLRGLAPGIVEDAKSALNPVPLMKAIFGSGYPLCKLEEKQVGDQDGYIQKRKTLDNGRLESTPSGPYFIDQPESAYKKADGKFYQKRWTYAGDLTEIQWQNAQKTHCPDGFPMKNHRNGRCELPLVSSVLDGFQSTSNPNTKILLGIAILGSLVTLKYIAKSHK